MGATAKTPNAVLRAIREDELHLSRPEFAQAMADAAAALGEKAACGERQVARLEDGDVRYPQPPYQRILSVVCGRPFTLLGFPPRRLARSGAAFPAVPASPGAAPDQPNACPHVLSETVPGLVYEEETTVTLVAVGEIGRQDVNRRDLLIGSPFVVAAFAVPSRDWLLASLEQPTVSVRSDASAAPVAAVRAAFRTFQELDVLRGGGDLARRAVARHLTDQVLPLLRRRQSPPARLALCEAASEQTYLAGWMAYNSGRDGLAQRYLIQALSLAQASGNRALGSHVLVGMGDMAVQAGRSAEALRLIRAGRHGLAGQGSPAAVADLHVMEARALAALGRARECAAALLAAERSFDQIDPDAEPEWARFIDEAYLAGEIAASLRDAGDGTGAERYARQSIAAATRQRRSRRAAFSYAALAAAQVRQNELEAAAESGQRACDLAGQVPAASAARCAAALDGLGLRLAPHVVVPQVRDLVERLGRTANNTKLREC